MQKFSKEQLAAQADKFMKAHGVESFLATEDGNFFHPKDRCLAHDHNQKNVKGEVHEFGTVAPADEAANDHIPPVIHDHDVNRHGEKQVVNKPVVKGPGGKKGKIVKGSI